MIINLPYQYRAGECPRYSLYLPYTSLLNTVATRAGFSRQSAFRSLNHLRYLVEALSL